MHSIVNQRRPTFLRPFSAQEVASSTSFVDAARGLGCAADGEHGGLNAPVQVNTGKIDNNSTRGPFDSNPMDASES